MSISDTEKNLRCPLKNIFRDNLWTESSNTPHQHTRYNKTKRSYNAHTRRRTIPGCLISIPMEFASVPRVDVFNGVSYFLWLDISFLLKFLKKANFLNVE